MLFRSAELIEALDGELDESAGPAIASADPVPTAAVAAPKALAPAQADDDTPPWE